MVDSSAQTTDVDQAIQAEIDLESEPLVLGGLDYHEAYRDGNFGLKRGRINFHRARKWSKAHLMLAVVIEILSITVLCLILGNNWYWIDDHTATNLFVFSISCGIIAIATSCCSLYLLRYIATVKRPLFVLLLVRLLAVLECLLAVTTLVTTIVAVSDSHEFHKYYRYSYDRENTVDIETADNFGLFIFLCVLLVIALLLDIITAMAWLFHWWRCCDCCQQFKSFCIFEPGQPLAEGVSDPRTGILRECVYICWAAYKTDCGTII